MQFKMNEIEREVTVFSADLELKGILALPREAKAMIIFAHGSGSGRFSPRNNFVARVLQQAGFGTFMMDLLTEEESLNRENVFDIDLLAARLNTAKKWIAEQRELSSLPIGFFGASTGAAAAIQAVALDPERIFALVSRGGRPDLAGLLLKRISVPTLLIVGGNDGVVIDLNQEAFAKMNCQKEIKIIPGATHLFEESGTLEQVAELAKDWFLSALS